MADRYTPCCILGASDDILHTLEVFGLHSDETILYLSQRTVAYDEAFHKLQSIGAIYPCCCTRKEIADSALHGIKGLVYPCACHRDIPTEHKGRAWLLRTDISPSTIAFDDVLQGHISNTSKKRSVISWLRADGFSAYQLAVVVDDASQRITHDVRGANLLASTPRPIYLQRLLGLTAPTYMHLPIAVNVSGEKLSKQTLVTPVDCSQPVAALLNMLDFYNNDRPQS